MVLVFAETWNGQFKKSTFEAVRYGASCAQMAGSHCTALVMGACDNPSELATHGAENIIHVSDAGSFEPHAFAGTMADIAQKDGAKALVIAGTSNGKALAGILAIKANAAAISQVIALPESMSPLSVERSAFSSKGLEICASNAAQTVLTLIPNAIGMTEVSPGAGNLQSAGMSGTALVVPGEQTLASGSIPLPEAERVVSAGRGLKAAENWGMVEALATVLGATTACSKPVSDIGWRPHSEHVGQTGIQINPQLYIAIGISGAIQHLAGVSGSKVIVAINIDPEAPFFKAADYGVVGDAFEVVPKLTEALKKHFA